jgi:hypothetical protein
MCEQLPLYCPYGQPGEQRWVRETFTLTQFGKPVYRADGKDADGHQWAILPGDPKHAIKWHSAVHMSQSASRLTVEVLTTGAGRVQDMTEEQADAVFRGNFPDAVLPDVFYKGREYYGQFSMAECFGILWDTHYGKQFPWASNPWNWTVMVRRVE